MSLLKILEEEVKNILTKNKNQSVSHRWMHITRVRHTALTIAKSYPEVDKELLELAVLLHDIDQPYNLKNEHIDRSINLSEHILKKVGASDEKIQRVINVIEQHSTERISNAPMSIEAKILFDADKIDGLGANGIARVFALFGQRGLEPENAIQWYKEKIEISLKNLHTEEGREIFMKKLNYVQEFFERFEKENRDVLL